MPLGMLAMMAGLIAQSPASTVEAPNIATCLARVKEVHGGTGPWAVVGYRIGQRALKDLGVERHSFSLRVVHRSPAEVQYTCVADGLQAATGVSAGKLNLKLEEAPSDQLKTVVSDRATGRTLTFTIRPDFARTILDIPYERLEREGERVAGLADDAMFRVEEGREATKPNAP